MNAASSQPLGAGEGAFSPRVNAVSPGLTDTEAYAGMDPAAREKLLVSAAENLPAKPSGGQRTSQKAICS